MNRTSPDAHIDTWAAATTQFCSGCSRANATAARALQAPRNSGYFMSSESLHESTELLSEKTKNLHRAIVTLIEELEAVDWYQQRSDACTDDELRAVIEHNRREEIEHAMMTLEWLRRNHSDFAEQIGTYLFTHVPITEVEEVKKSELAAPDVAVAYERPTTLGIGSLRGAK